MRSQADALLACDFIETVTLTGQRQYILAIIEHATRRVRMLGTAAHPTAARVAQAERNLVMDLEEAGATVEYLIRDRDAKFPPLFDEILAHKGIQVVLSGIRMPQMSGFGVPGCDPGSMFLSLAYRVTRRVLGSVAVLFGREVSKDAELLVLRHENAVLRRQIVRVRYEPADRFWFAALSSLIASAMG